MNFELLKHLLFLIQHYLTLNEIDLKTSLLASIFKNGVLEFSNTSDIFRFGENSLNESL